jgi:2-oxoglutarate dehydrogenase E2 component (dihydrolipoamide succinyltransferase)
MGEGIIEATITRWFVKEGDSIRVDQTLLEVATDKVDSEIPAPVSGRIIRILYHEGEIPKVGEVLAVIESGKENHKTDSTEEKMNHNEFDTEYIIAGTPDKKDVKTTLLNRPDKNTFAENIDLISSEQYLSPLIRFMARQRNIPIDELKHLKGTGLNGRLTKEDLNSYIRSGRPYRHILSGNGYAPERILSEQPETSSSSNYRQGPGEEVIEMDRTRKLIAEHMVRSKRTSAHVTSMVEVDVTELVRWRNENKERFYTTYGIKLTYTPVIVEASVKALKEFTGINISVIGDRVIKKHYYNIGVATALPDGNLIVPVIKAADKDNFSGIARKLNDLADRARKRQLMPAETKGSTFTITNMGQYNNITGTPIINQPEVAILAVGVIKKKPAVVQINNQPAIGIRDILLLSLTYDHRVVDGALGGSFLNAIGKKLEEELPVF